MSPMLCRIACLVGVLFATASSLALRHGGDDAMEESFSTSAALEVLEKATAVLLNATRVENPTSNASNSTSNASNSTSNASKQVGAKPVVHNVTALKEQQDVLQKLFAHLKSNIAECNQRETSGKDEHQKLIDKVKQRLEHDQKQLNSSNVSKFEYDLLVNRTRQEQLDLTYWTRGRELQHGMFHSNLKMTHSMMSKVKSVMDAYKEVLASGKLDGKVAQEFARASAGIPKH